MKPVGAFVEAKSYWCPNCGTNLEHKRIDGEWALWHKDMPGQEFCPNWGKSFHVPMVSLTQVSASGNSEASGK